MLKLLPVKPKHDGDPSHLSHFFHWWNLSEVVSYNCNGKAQCIVALLRVQNQVGGEADAGFVQKRIAKPWPLEDKAMVQE